MTVRTWCDTCRMYHAPSLNPMCSNYEEMIMVTAVKGTISVERANNMERLCKLAVEVLKTKNPKYGDSWKSHGGFSAFFNMHRKWSRVEHLAAQHGYDVFAALEATAGEPDGMEEALRDLMGYDILVLDEMLLADATSTRLKIGPERERDR